MIEVKNQFLDMLHNRQKERTTCLIAWLNGSVDGTIVTELQPAQDWCFATEQDWNSCYTARYRADGRGSIIAPLIRQFCLDVKARNEKETKRPGTIVGSFQLAENMDWGALESELSNLASSADINDRELIASFGSMLRSLLREGQRLVLFCEIDETLSKDDQKEDPGNNSKPNLGSIGLDEESVRFLLELMSERFVLVISGVKRHSTDDIDKAIQQLDIGPDYLTTQPPDDRSQRLLSDADEGDDQLNIIGEVNALADAIAAGDMEPPLVAGILGGWGSGKSYVMHLLKQRLLEIRRKNIFDPAVRASSPYAGHFYLVNFDAWTYAKADLWASLMQEVLLALNDQISYEQLKIDNLPDDSSSIRSDEELVTLLDDIRKESGEFNGEAVASYVRTFTDNKGAGPEDITAEILTTKYQQAKQRLFDARFKTILCGEDKFDSDVVKQLAAVDADAKLVLEQLDKDNVLWARLQGLNEKLQGQLTKLEKQLQDERLNLAEENSKIEETADSILYRERWKTYAEGLTGRLGQSFKTEVEGKLKQKGQGKAIPFDEALASIGLFEKLRAGKSSRTLLVFIIFAIATALVASLAQQVEIHLVGLSSLVGGFLGGAAEAWQAANQYLAGKIKEFEKFDETMRTRQQQRREAIIEHAQVERKSFQQVSRKVAELESQVASYQHKIGLTAGHPTLLDFISHRLQDEDYEEKLGPLQQVQRDIQQLSDGLRREELCVEKLPVSASVSLEKILFPRGLPRVVLFIDDLDRCPPARVVEVLEAAQLLVKTSLFVVVMAMDVRYITKALEKAYAGVLDSRGDPSGLDYIEKIIQVPYRVRPISAEAMPNYLRSQMHIKRERQEELEITVDLQGNDNESVIYSPGKPDIRIDETVPHNILAFDETELVLIQNGALAVGIGPRATKRLVNVMKLIKIIWYRTGRDDISDEIKKTVVFFLTLSARYAVIMRRVLLEMESALADSDKKAIEKNMPLFTKQIIDNWRNLEGRKADWDFLARASKREDLLPRDMTLKKLDVRNIELIRSFSFVGEVDMPPEPHHVSMRLEDNVKINLEQPAP